MFRADTMAADIISASHGRSVHVARYSYIGNLGSLVSHGSFLRIARR
jgi:hypothetical protein